MTTHISVKWSLYQHDRFDTDSTPTFFKFIATLLCNTHGVRCDTQIRIAIYLIRYFESYDLMVLRCFMHPYLYFMYYISVMVKNKPFRHDLISSIKH